MPIPQARQRPDPSAQVIACEQCGAMTTIGDSHSFVIVYATTGPGGRIPSFQCPAEQHFACSQECAALLGHMCIDEHLRPLHSQKLSISYPAQVSKE